MDTIELDGWRVILRINPWEHGEVGGGGDKKGGGACRKISPGFPQGPPCTSTLAYEQAHASIGAQARAA